MYASVADKNYNQENLYVVFEAEYFWNGWVKMLNLM